MTAHLATMFMFSGALVAGYLVAALFFLNFWRSTRDRLFCFFAGAFSVLAVQRVVLAWDTMTHRDTTVSYILRVVAFVLILIAILDKNRTPRAGA